MDGERTDIYPGDVVSAPFKAAEPTGLLLDSIGGRDWVLNAKANRVQIEQHSTCKASKS